MKIVHISDTHNQIGSKGDPIYDSPRKLSLELPEGDVLIHSGDHTAQGTRNQAERAAEWLGSYKDRFKHILAIAGNHDFVFQDKPGLALKIFAREGVKYLCDSKYEIDGVVFYGSPWQPWFHDWAFNFPERDGETAARNTWAKIPESTNVLITHGPAHGRLDKTHGGWDTRVGCPYLRGRIEELNNLKLHAFGHIHESNGVIVVNQVIFSNASICNRKGYAPDQPFNVFEI